MPKLIPQTLNPIPPAAPTLYIIAGPNGAGKTTAAMTLLPEFLRVKEFVNADEIARGLSPFNVEGVAIQAGKLMLKRLEDLAAAGEDFTFETTLASKIFAKFARKIKLQGYTVNLIYVWLPEPSMALQRVALRVSRGGHFIPDEVVLRRYRAGIKNLFDIYLPLLDSCHIVDNSCQAPLLLAKYDGIGWHIADEEKWNLFRKYADEPG